MCSDIRVLVSEPFSFALPAVAGIGESVRLGRYEDIEAESSPAPRRGIIRHVQILVVGDSGKSVPSTCTWRLFQDADGKLPLSAEVTTTLQRCTSDLDSDFIGSEDGAVWFREVQDSSRGFLYWRGVLNNGATFAGRVRLTVTAMKDGDHVCG